MFTRGALLYIGQRLVLIAFTAVAVSSIVFLGIHRLPGDALLNERRPDPGAERELLHYYGLDLPLSQQYFRFVGGVLLGVIAAVRQNTWVDYLATTTSVIGYSMPNFVIASLLFLLFGVALYSWTGGALY